MGTCQCTQKDIEQAKISNVNVDDLNTNTNSKHYKKQQTVQTNLDNDKSQSKYSPLSPKRELNEIQNMTLKQISPSKIKNRNNINIILLGGASVGKSSFLIKLTESTFEKLYIPTICRDIRSKVISYNTHNFKFHFTDTATNDYKEDYTKEYQDSDFFLVFYDVTDANSFKEAQKIIDKEIKKYHAMYSNISNIILVGNKNDELRKNVNTDEVTKYCSSNNIQFFEISVKTNKNMNAMMQTIVKAFDNIAYP